MARSSGTIRAAAGAPRGSTALAPARRSQRGEMRARSGRRGPKAGRRARRAGGPSGPGASRAATAAGLLVRGWKARAAIRRPSDVEAGPAEPLQEASLPIVRDGRFRARRPTRRTGCRPAHSRRPGGGEARTRSSPRAGPGPGRRRPDVAAFALRRRQVGASAASSRDHRARPSSALCRGIGRRSVEQCSARAWDTPRSGSRMCRSGGRGAQRVRARRGDGRTRSKAVGSAGHGGALGRCPARPP